MNMWFKRSKKCSRTKFNPESGTHVVVWKRPRESRRGKITGRGDRKHTYFVEFLDENGNPYIEEIPSHNMEKDWRVK